MILNNVNFYKKFTEVYNQEPVKSNIKKNENRFAILSFLEFDKLMHTSYFTSFYAKIKQFNKL